MIIIERTHCAVCRCTDFGEFAELGHRRIVRCRSCSYVFAAQFDEQALERAYLDDYYASKDDERIGDWVRDNEGVWGGLCETLESELCGPASLLDVGSGTGGFLLDYHRRNPGVALFGIESSENARASLAERLPGIEFVAEDAGQLAGVERKFDAITLLQTLEHVYEPAGLCQAAFHALNPGGVFLVTVPNLNSFRVTLRGTADTMCFGNPTHLQFFDRTALVSMLRAAGFEQVERVKAFGGSNVQSLPLKVAQYGLRLVGRSTELRYLARR